MRANLLLILFVFSFGVFGQPDEKNIVDRLDSLGSSFELDFNGDVRSAIYEFIENRGGKTTSVLSKYLTLDQELKEVFVRNSTPIEFRYACIALSDCNNFYNDADGREGYYKMRYNVAKSNGLYISNFVDERKNILKAADAFCKEINNLYFKSDDWKSAYVAYCSGNLQWQKAKLNSDDLSNDFWKINQFLPFEHRVEYPRLIAAIYIANYYWVHNIQTNIKEVDTEQVPIKQSTTLYQLAVKLDIDFNELKELNPIYKKNSIPNSGGSYYLVLPKDKVEDFYSYGPDVYNYTEVKRTAQTKVVYLEGVNANSLPVLESDSSDITEVSYFVKSGDFLLLIADYFDCTVSDLRNWNSLKGDSIDVNQKLKVLVASDKEGYYSSITNLTSTERRQIAAKD